MILELDLYQVITGDALATLHTRPDNSIDSLVTDPPCGISFMGKDWDGSKGGRDEWIEWLRLIMAECVRVLKPGGHGLVWALPRTSHWTGMALELAGFEVRDCIDHVFGTGFPKSLNVSKQIDKMAGVEREVLREYEVPDIRNGHGREYGSGMYAGEKTARLQIMETADTTDEAKKWAGFGSALKPGHENWWLVRKPLEEKGIARQVLKTGTGAINVGACRVPANDKAKFPAGVISDTEKVFGKGSGMYDERPRPTDKHTQGRFPPNMLFTHNHDCTNTCTEGCPVAELTGAARFFPIFRYQAKPSTRERKAGISTPEKQKVFNGQSDHSAGNAPGSVEDEFTNKPARNHHPTVKSIELMRWLVRLVTPPGGIVLDPFTGSGSTGCAAMMEGMTFTGIELSEEYADLARQRVDFWAQVYRGDITLEEATAYEEEQLPGQLTIFDTP